MTSDVRTGQRARPLPLEFISELVSYVRAGIGLQDCMYLCPVRLIEVLQYKERLTYEVVGDDLFEEGVEAFTWPDSNEMKIRESVFDAASVGEPRARFTLAHELGHWLLHKNTAYARHMPGQHPQEESAEWQADIFASELLMPKAHIKDTDDVEDLMSNFGVTHEDAVNRLAYLNKDKAG